VSARKRTVLGFPLGYNPQQTFCPELASRRIGEPTRSRLLPGGTLYRARETLVE